MNHVDYFSNGSRRTAIATSIECNIVAEWNPVLWSIVTTGDLNLPMVTSKCLWYQLTGFFYFKLHIMLLSKTMKS